MVYLLCPSLPTHILDCYPSSRIFSCICSYDIFLYFRGWFSYTAIPFLWILCMFLDLLAWVFSLTNIARLFGRIAVHFILRTVPTNGKYFFPDNDYVRQVDHIRGYWNPKRKLGVTTHFSESASIRRKTLNRHFLEKWLKVNFSQNFGVYTWTGTNAMIILTRFQNKQQIIT